MSYLLNMALSYHQGKTDGAQFMMQYITQRHGNFTTDNDAINQAECEIFSACDRFDPELGQDGVGGRHDINETQFRQEVAQALKSVGMI